jgi:hypothetical protein
MANSYKDIIITPNRSSSTVDPKIEFRGGNTSVNTAITIQTYPTSNGTLSFEGSAGQLFSVTNDLSGSIFSVNDVSGIPSLEVFANGQINIAQFGGNVFFSNTIVDSPTMKGYKEFANTASITGATTLDLSTTNIYNITLTGSATLTFSNPPTSGTLYSLMIIAKQDATGSRTITWPASVKWPNASAPTLSTAANAVDVLNFFTVDGGTTYYGALSLICCNNC